MTSHVIPSYLSGDALGPWGVFLQQIDRVTPYLGELAFWIESLKRPKRILIVDVPIKMDDGSVAHFEGYRVQHNSIDPEAKAIALSLGHECGPPVGGIA